MNRRHLIAAVIVLVIVVGGIFLLIGILMGDSSTDGSNPTQGLGDVAHVSRLDPLGRVSNPSDRIT